MLRDNTDDLEKLIKEALSSHDRDLLEGTEELGWFQLGLKQFGGKLGWVTWLLVIVQSIMFVVAIWCAVRFFGTTELLAALRWGLSSATLMLMALQIKMSLMPQMQADRVIREVKRLQLLMVSKED